MTRKKISLRKKAPLELNRSMGLGFKTLIMLALISLNLVGKAQIIIKEGDFFYPNIPSFYCEEEVYFFLDSDLKDAPCLIHIESDFQIIIAKEYTNGLLNDSIHYYNQYNDCFLEKLRKEKPEQFEKFIENKKKLIGQDPFRELLTKISLSYKIIFDTNSYFIVKSRFYNADFIESIGHFSIIVNGRHYNLGNIPSIGIFLGENIDKNLVEYHFSNKKLDDIYCGFNPVHKLTNTDLEILFR